MVIQSMEMLNWFLFINYPYPTLTDCFVVFDLADLFGQRGDVLVQPFSKAVKSISALSRGIPIIIVLS